MTMRNLKTTLFSLVLAAVMAFPVMAHAGRGASYASVVSAIRTNNADTIISELERAERLTCGACIEPIMNLLDHDDYRVREVAAWWMARRPAQKEEVRDTSIARLYGSDSILARNGADALGTFRNPDAIPALSFAATRADLTPEARAAAVQALGTIAHPNGAPAIISAMNDSDATVRATAVNAYYALRGDRDGAPLLALVGDSDVYVRQQTTAVLGTLKYAGAVSALESALASDSDAQVRRNAAWALGQIGDGGARATLETASTKDSSSIVRSVAKAAIRSLH
jgi:HEAT repeat protein